MHRIFSNQQIVREILVRSTDNSALAIVNKFIHLVSKSDETRAKWIEYRKKELELWIKTFHLVMKDQRVFESFSEWLAYQSYPVHQDPTTFGTFLSNESIIHQLLKNAFVNGDEVLIELYWDVLASRGSMLGLAFALKTPKMQEYLESNIQMSTNAIYVSLCPAELIDEQQSLDLIKFFSTFGPRETCLQEAFEYACFCRKKLIVGHALLHASFPTIVNGLVQAKNQGWKEIETLIYSNLKIERKQDWDKLKAMLELVEKDKCYLFKNELVQLYERQTDINPSPNMGLFLEQWTSCVGQAVFSGSKNTLEFLLNIEQFPKLDLFVPLALFGKALELGDVEICEMVAQHLDCSDSKIPAVKKLQMILQEYCSLSKRQLFSRLYPLVSLVDTSSIEYIKQHQQQVILFLYKTLVKMNPQFMIPSVCIWKALQVQNFEIAEELQKLGGVATWLDAERQVGAKMKMEMSTADQSFVDDDRTGLFQAYGGNGGGLGLRQVIPETESEMETDTDFKSTLRASAENLAMNSRRSSAAVGWTDYRLNRRKSAMNLSLLGSKRVVLRNQETTRLFVPRKSSFANVESDRIWNSYFTATKNEIEKIFEQSEKIEWMEHTAESVLNEGYNASQEPIMVRDLSQLY